jgi:hypothetical protein
MHAQELQCQVTINTSRIQNSVTRIFESMRNDIMDFMNSRSWTNDTYTANEKIQCNLFITINEQLTNTKFTATIQVQSNRPVYNSAYSSPILNINDTQFEFEYMENTQINFSPDQHRNNFTSVLAYYAYLIIAHDYDTFRKNGGTPYYNLAQRVVNNAQSAAEPGWRAFESTQNRYWIVENILNSPFIPMRECLYEYHRNGLDKMYNDPIEGRANITRALEKLNQVHQTNPSSYNVQIFFQAKSDEVVGIYSNAQPTEKNTIYNLLQRIDAGNVKKYSSLKDP